MTLPTETHSTTGFVPAIQVGDWLLIAAGYAYELEETMG